MVTAFVVAFVALIAFCTGVTVMDALHKKREKDRVADLPVIKMWESFHFEAEGGSRTKMSVKAWQYDGHTGHSAITATTETYALNGGERNDERDS